MKRITLLALSLSFIFSFGLSAQTAYVSATASGSGDGTSWENAYTELQAALDDETATEVWVATGIYSTAAVGRDSLAVYTITRPLNLYGGFAGTESAIEDRDIAANVTTLSGDIAGDDLPDDVSTNRTDNSFHILYVDSLLTTPVVVDGITFSGGQSAGTNNSLLRNRSGAGVLALSTVNVSNCTFTNNFAFSGAGVYLIFGASNSVVENCTFTKNTATSQSAGVMMNTLSNVQVRNCVFDDNTTNRGVVYPLFSDNISISNCLFINNNNNDGFSAGIFNWQSTNFKLSDC
ncbi:MAG: right-handed parallel beta-helix repeat-containing protein, partial [Saprospiraceae bacterium]